MPKFRTKYDRVVTVSDPGDPIRTIRAGELKNNVLTVVEKGKEDFYAYINSFADSVNIHVLLNRFKNGDTESLMQRAGAYIDISALPTNINEFMQLARNAENLFNSLPIETKNAFNNNVVEFISTIGDDDWKEKMSMSPADIKYEKDEAYKQATKAHKKAIKNGFDNTVYGDDYSPSDGDSSKPSVNPLTGNEVNG